jgi:uncharacterized protein YjeT (DUF2065 family)
MLREFVASSMLRRVASAVDAPDAQLRVATAAAQLVGVVLLRYVIGVPPLATASDEEIVALVAPTLQRYLTGG